MLNDLQSVKPRVRLNWLRIGKLPLHWVYVPGTTYGVACAHIADGLRMLHLTRLTDQIEPR